jgi:LysR family hydrogen peroxide-inducible transcriptional activator
MELQQLRYVIAVARAGNFSRAAEQCHVAQPSLSQQIQKLENELGEKLFHRLKRAVKLTPPGEAFLRRALRILDEVDSAVREASETKQLVRGRLTIGIIPTLAPYLLPKIMSLFIRKFPGVEIEVQEDTTSRLIPLLLACEIDFALASQPINHGQLRVQELFAEELLLAIPPGHALARKRTISARDLDGQRLIVLKAGHCLGDQVLNFCERRDVQPSISFRSAQLETIQSLVRSGVGLSLIPKMATRSGAKLKYRAFINPRPQRKIVALWPTQRPPGRAAREFLALIEKRKTAWRTSP